MFWKKSKDKQSTTEQNKSKSISTTIYRTDCGSTSTGNGVTSYQSKSKSSSKTSSNKTTITISTKQSVSKTQNFSEVSTKYTQRGSAVSALDLSSLTVLNQPQIATILPRQKTESSIVRRIDATTFNSKYESPYRKVVPLPLSTPALSSYKTTYQSPYRNTSTTSSTREKNTTVVGPRQTITSTASELLSTAPKAKTKTIWEPISKIENAKAAYTPSWSNMTSLSPKASNPLASTTKNLLPAVAVIQTSSKKKKSPGVAYIFHNDKFDGPDKEFRIGSIEDVHLLKKTFQSFKMHVTLYENLTVKEVDNMVRKIEIKDFGSASCIVIVVLTHGTRYETVAAKDGSYSIDDNVLFPILRNRSLRSKPKLLFIQACKGAMETGGFHRDAMQPNGTPDEILKCNSTFEGYVAYRTEKGSLFIQSLCELLQMHGKTKNIKEIMDEVIRRVRDRTNGKQIPSYATTLTEPYIFGDYV